MIADPGRPFSRSFADLIADMQTRLTLGVEMPQSREYVYQENVSSYDLPPDMLALTAVWALVPVSGSAGPLLVNCQPGRDDANNLVVGGDYVTRGSKLVWRTVHKGDDGPETLLKPGMKFTVEYTVRGTPSGINDFLPGSIAGVLVRAITREMALMYNQIDEAYRRAFLMQAEGIALDNVVALLGVQRNPAVKAVGMVTFAVKQTPSALNPKSPQPVPIPQGTQVADTGGRLFATLAYGEIGINNLNAQISAAALEPGPQGNVAVNTIMVMPTPPRGVDSVTNAAAFTGGQVAETDDDLRERAQHALDRAGRGTLDAIKYAVKEIQGVEDVKVLDHTLDTTIPLGEVHVYYSGGNNSIGLDNKVPLVVNDTRAAGIYARIFTIDTVNIGGIFYVLPDVGMPNTAPAAFLQDVVGAITALPVGGALSLRRLNALAYNTEGLKDVAEAQLTQSVRGTTQPIATDPLAIKPTDTLATTSAAIQVIPIRTFVLASTTPITSTLASGSYPIKMGVQLTDGTNGAKPFAFINFTLNVLVTLTVPSKTNDKVSVTLAPYRAVAAFTGDGKTASVATVQVSVPTADLPTDRKSVIHVVVTAESYPALLPAITDVTLQP